MADPFSVAVGVASVVDLTIKVVRFINDTRKGTEAIDQDLESLVTDVKELQNICQLISNAFEDDMRAAGKTSAKANDTTASIWGATASALEGCRVALSRLHNMLGQVKGADGTSAWDKLRRHFRKMSKEEEFITIRQRIGSHQQVLEISLLTLNMYVTLSCLCSRALR